MDFVQVLEKALLGTDAQARAEAETQLKDAARDHFVPYMGMLTTVLADTNNRIDVRVLAAIALKNELVAKDLRTKESKAQRWIAIDQGDKAQIKRSALEALTTPSERVASAAAQLVAAIADIELPLGQWQELPGLLVESTKPEVPDNVKKASLIAIGYICETADPNNPAVVSQMDGFLTAIIQGAQKSEPNEVVRFAAMEALVNSLDFVKNNFANESERNFIMQVICEATEASSPELQSCAFNALSRTMLLYYEYMRPYMEQALFSLTVAGMNSSNDMVASMAVEFWSTVCEEEIEIMLTEAEAETSQIALPANARQNFHFVNTALDKILPTLLSLLTKKDEDADDDEWSVAMAAGACLTLLAQNVRNAVIPVTLQFVEANLSSSNWANRDAAIMAFGSILDGPDPNSLRQLIQQALQPLLSLMNDPSTHVKDTVAWCLGRIADSVVSAIDVEKDLPPMIHALLAGLQDAPGVATNCCWTIMNLSEQLSVTGDPTSPLAQFYPQLITSLLQSSARSDNENSARTSAYEALSTLVVFATVDVENLVLELSGAVLERLHATFAMQHQIVSGDDRASLEELQVNLLGLLTNIIRRVGSKVQSGADQLMTMFLELLQNKLPNSLVEEDVFIAVGAVAGAIGPAFEPYATAFVAFIVNALKEPDLPSSSTAVGLIADISHALGPAMSGYVPMFMAELLTILQNNDVRREIKPVVLSCIGDIASSVGGASFEPYLVPVHQILVQGARLELTADMPTDTVDYILTLRDAILDAYVGITVGMRETPHKIQPIIPDILQFLHLVSQEPEFIMSESSVRSAVGLIGDIASMYPNGEFREMLQQQWISDVIKKARDKSYGKTTRDMAKWAREQQKRQL